MRKFKFFIDFNKEEKWLEDMAKKGYELEGKSLGYNFRYAEPEDAVIRIDYRTFKKQENFIDYCTLFEDSGWKHIAGSKSSGTQYFKKIKEDSEDDIFSDSISKAGKYKRLSKMFINMAICYLPILMALSSTDAYKIRAIFNPKLLYLTPGLWGMNGASFWRAFLFETPFALMRGILLLYFPFTIILFLLFAFKAQRLYEENKGR